MGKTLIKLHEGNIVSLCDSDILGKTFEDDDITLDVSERFYKGQEMEDKEIVEVLKEAGNVNIVGRQSVKLAMEAGIVKEEGVKKVQDVPFAMIFAVA